MTQCSKRIILGSASPRRRELLSGLGLDFTVDTGNTFIEMTPPGTSPEKVPVLMAEGKSEGFHRALEKDEVLITADTVVIVAGIVLGKPKDRDDAVRMLNLLSGRTHRVITAVCLRSSKRNRTFTDTTFVTFEKLSDRELNYYIDNFAPFDKAGAYGIQEWIGYRAISRIDGSFYNVMGMPVSRVIKELEKFF